MCTPIKLLFRSSCTVIIGKYIILYINHDIGIYVSKGIVFVDAVQYTQAVCGHEIHCKTMQKTCRWDIHNKNAYGLFILHKFHNVFQDDFCFNSFFCFVNAVKIVRI